MDWVGNQDYILTDVLTSAKCILDGPHEVHTLEKLAIVIHIVSLEELCPAKFLQKDVVRSLTSQECFFCAVSLKMAHT